MTTTFPSAKTRALLAAAVLLAAALPAIATSDTWNWEDRSGVLPLRDGVTLSIVSERQNSWLLSDNSHVYQFDGTHLQDLTRNAREHGLLGISGAFSDDRTWLVYHRPLDRREPLVWFTDGQTWIDGNGKFSGGEGGLDAVGRDGVWYVRTYTQATRNTPSSWTLYRLNGLNAPATRLDPPTGLSALRAGCFQDVDGSTLCNGVSTPLFVHDATYLVGGTSQAQGPSGVVTQTARAGIWVWREGMWTPMSMPAAHFVSAVWPGGNDMALIATSEARTNPFAADHLWVFNGTDLRDVSDLALSQGLLSVDAREIHAAWNGRAWVLLLGKKLVRFDGTRMTDEGTTRDVFSTLAGNNDGLVVLGGAVSDPTHAFATEPLTAKLVTLEEDLSTPVSAPATVTPVASELISKLFGPRVSVTNDPTSARIANGRVFTFTATAEDASGVQRMDIYAHGARIKSCFDRACSYTQTYWTNGVPQRSMEFFARALNGKGYVNESEHTTLVIDTALNRSNEPPPVVSSEWLSPTPAAVKAPAPSTTAPSNLIWTSDRGSGITLASWMDPDERTLKSGGLITYGVTARAPQIGLSRMEVWVNGQIKMICSFPGVKDAQSCRFGLSADAYPADTDVFVNARLQNARGQEAWSTGVLLHRERANVAASNAPTPAAPSNVPAPTPAAPPTGPLFSSSATLEPSVATLVRGATLTFKSSSLNNTHGIDRVEIYVNGSMERACTYGAAMSAVPCEAAVDTARYQPGTTITFMARAIETQGKDVWSNAKSVLVLATAPAPTSNEAPATNGTGLSIWSWMAPTVSQISVDETTTYTVGAWASSGVRSIEMIADGIVRRTCSFGGAKGSKECTYTISTQDFSDGHTVSVNARVTDGNGNVTWADARTVTTKRSWTPLNDPIAYTQLTATPSDGYHAGDRIRLQARGWSPRQVERLDIFVNGVQVASCPTDTCSWTSQPFDRPFIEYQARVTDRLQQETWTALSGLSLSTR